MPDTPVSENPVLTTFEIKANGSSIDDTIGVRSISIRKEINKIPYARISMYDWNPESLDFDNSNSDTFVPGTKIEISAGYESDNDTIFSGIIVRHGLKIDTNNASTLEIECRDPLLKMTVGRKNAYYTKQKDSDIISTLVSNNGGSATVDSTNVEHEEMMQYYCSDWDFVLARADANGLVAIVDDSKITVQKPAVSESAVLTVTHGADLHSFDVEMDAEQQLSSVQATAWDMSSQANIQASGSDPSINSQGNIDNSTLADVLGVSDFGLQTTAAVTQDDLTSWADAQLQKSWLSKFSGMASFKGSSDAVPGSIIEFKNVGDRLSGSAYISAVEHEISQGDWVTTVELGMKAEWFTEKVNINAPNAAGLLGGISGLMIGTVKQLDQDPDSQFRIQLTLPMMQSDSDGVWARLANFYATSNAGLFWIPEIGDEVVVGFLNGDPQYPIVIGALYSSSHTAPYDLTKENYTKAFVTKEQNKIEFDDENKVITVTTPGNNQAILSDEDKSITVQDQNSNSIVLNEDGITLKDKSGNKIVMSSSGIEINSSSDVKIVATQDINESATGNIKQSATQNVTVSGLQISNSAQTSFKASGNASAELSATGQTSVKGAMVMIN